MRLHDYFRSTASYRVRIALNFKNINYDKIEVHLVNNGGEQNSPAYKDINPQGLVPTLDINHNINLTQSMAILEYLEETYPTPPLLPSDNVARAHVRAMANIIACDIHPLNNLRILKYLKNDLDINDAEKNQWYHHWILTGFAALEKLLLNSNSKFCYGNSPTFADLCLIPQVYNANRFNCSLDEFPKIYAINEYCLGLKEFQVDPSAKVNS